MLSRSAPSRTVKVGVLAIVAVGLAATVVSAAPASAPTRDAIVAPPPAEPVRIANPDHVAVVAFGARLSRVGADVTLPPPTTPTTAAPTTTTTTTAPPPPPTTAPPAPVSNGSVWDALARCESGGNWAINTGNGYYGGLQFSLSSWQAVGGTGYPHQASRETQIAMGERLRASGGWGHWPHCSRKLGLR